MLTPKGVTVTGTLIYDKDKTSYRSEVDEALTTKPDLLYLNGYAPDVAVILRDLYRADYDRNEIHPVLCADRQVAAGAAEGGDRRA